METSIHSHLAAQYIQDRMTRATAERSAREARAQSRPSRRARWMRLRRSAIVSGPALSDEAGLVPARPLPR